LKAPRGGDKAGLVLVTARYEALLGWYRIDFELFQNTYVT
jgi:hypothetical protein